MEQIMAIFQHLPEPMVILDKNLIVVKANDAFSKFVGKQPYEVVNMRVGKALRCENTYKSQIECGRGKLCFECELQAIIEEVISTEKTIQNIVMKYCVVANDRRTSLNLRVSAIPVVIGQIKYIAVMLVNVDDIIENTSFLEGTLEFIRLLFNSTSSFLWWIGTNGSCAYVNNSWLKFTGRTIEEELGYGWMDRLHPEDRILVQKSYQQTIDEYMENNVEFRAVQFDGEYRWINVTGRPVFSLTGQLVGYMGIGLDVTDKRLERNALEKYKLLSESVDDIILFFDKAGNILEANNSAIVSYGYTRQELLSLNISDISSDMDFSKHRPEKVGIKSHTYEMYHKKSDGSQLPVEVSINSAIINKDELIIAVIRNITERKKAEQKMRESELRYFSLFTNMSEAFLYARVVCDSKGSPVDYIILEVNSAFEKITGYRREEVLDKKASDINHDILNSEPNLVKICGQVALTGKEARFELKIDPSGKVYNVSTYSPQLGCFVNVFSDITEQRRAEQEIRKLSNAMEQSPVMSIITDTKGDVEYVNSKFAQLTGYSLEEIHGKHLDIILSGKMRDKFLSEILPAIIKGEGWSGELLNKKKNGEYFWASASISHIRDKNGEVIHYNLIEEDITERKALEKKLKLNNIKLTKAVKQLKSAQELLIQQEKLAGIGQLAAGVAHEINNPLGFVTSNFDILRKYMERISKLVTAYRLLNSSVKNNDHNMAAQHLQLIEELEKTSRFDFILEELNDIFDDCSEGLLRIRNIVNGLSTLVRSNQNETFKEYDINRGIESTLAVAHNEIKHHAEVRKELGDVPVIQALGEQINQVLLNIIVNAAQAIAAKNLKSKGLIAIRTYYDDKHVYCEISDDGIGISKGNIKKIFNPFFSTKTIGQGTGLGLSISYNIIANTHKGQIVVKSEERKGTKFTIKLPINNKKDK